jgi:hypothetical protein
MFETLGKPGPDYAMFVCKVVESALELSLEGATDDSCG